MINFVVHRQGHAKRPGHLCVEVKPSSKPRAPMFCIRLIAIPAIASCMGDCHPCYRIEVYMIAYPSASAGGYLFYVLPRKMPRHVGCVVDHRELDEIRSHKVGRNANPTGSERPTEGDGETQPYHTRQVAVPGVLEQNG